MNKLGYSTNGEDFNYSEAEDAADSYIGDLDAEVVLFPFTFEIFSCECIETTASELFDFNDVVEGMACRASDFAGEYADDWDVFGTKENHAKCQAEILKVVESHMSKTNFYQIGAIKKINVTCTAENDYTFD